MKPILTKTETTTCDGTEVTLIGEVFDEPIRKSENHTIYSHIKILTERGEMFHPGFSFPAQMTEHELDSELAFYKRSMNENPKAYIIKSK